jgi:hypothetical protein
MKDILREIDEFVLDEIDEFTSEPDKRKTSFHKKHPVALAILLVVAIVSGFVAGTVVLFDQTTTPGPSTQPPPPILTMRCNPVPTTATVPFTIGLPGFETWRCTLDITTGGAFHVNLAGIAHVVITKGAEWTKVCIIAAFASAPTNGCATAGKFSDITNGASTAGTDVTFGSGDIGDWYYCAEFTNRLVTMSAIQYHWTQG